MDGEQPVARKASMTAVTETTTATEKVALPEKAAERATEHRAGRLRRWRPSTVVRDSSLGQIGIFNSQTWVERTPWRPAAAWAAMAGLLAAGLMPTQVLVLWPTIVLLLLLVDLLSVSPQVFTNKRQDRAAKPQGLAGVFEIYL
jgi:hypothetical protein